MILLTGATGHVGIPLVNALLDRGERLRVLARDPEQAARLLPEEIDIARGEFADPASLAEALDDVDRAFLLSPSTEQMESNEIAFIDAAVTARVRHIVKLSVIAADPASPMRFMRIHAKIEAALKASPLQWTLLQPTFFMQNFLQSADTIKSQNAIYQPAGNATAAYIDVSDIAAVAATALTTPGHAGQTYVLTGPQQLTVSDIAATLSATLARTINYVDVPPDAARQALLASGAPEWNVDGILELMTALRAGHLSTQTDTVSKIASHPPKTFAQFAQQNANAFR